jgi:uncharacterized membrane protein
MNIYWLLAFLPIWIIHSLLFVGVAGLLVAFFVQRVPIVNTYGYLIKIVSLVLVVLGLFLQGALAYKESTALAVAKLEKKLAEAEAKSQKTNVEIVEKIVKDTEIVRVKGKTVTEYIDREIVKYDNFCELPAEVIRAHNAAATMDPSKLESDKK